MMQSDLRERLIRPTGAPKDGRHYGRHDTYIRGFSGGDYILRWLKNATIRDLASFN